MSAPNVTHDIARRLASFFEADAHGALAVYLFGSVARGEAIGGSNIDVGVLFADPPASTFERRRPAAATGRSAGSRPC